MLPTKATSLHRKVLEMQSNQLFCYSSICDAQRKPYTTVSEVLLSLGSLGFLGFLAAKARWPSEARFPERRMNPENR
jgi:hypothetical protein